MLAEFLQMKLRAPQTRLLLRQTTSFFFFINLLTTIIFFHYRVLFHSWNLNKEKAKRLSFLGDAARG
jgi:hypothetical protein